MQYWLMKSEPTTFSIDHLAQLPNQRDSWEGIRNYQVRNWLRDDFNEGDQAFFYHSNCKVPGIVGTMTIVRKAYPDITAFDPMSPYYDPTSDLNQPRWYNVDVQLKEKFTSIIPLTHLKNLPELQNSHLLRKGNRLSITPLTECQWQAIHQLT